MQTDERPLPSFEDDDDAPTLPRLPAARRQEGSDPELRVDTVREPIPAFFRWTTARG